MKKYLASIIVLFLSCIFSEPTQSSNGVNPIDVPKNAHYLNIDSIFNEIPQAPKVIYVYPPSRTAYAGKRDTVYIFRDREGEILMEITISSAIKSGRIRRDTVLISSEGYKIRSAYALWNNGEEDKNSYKQYENFDNKTPWSLDAELNKPLFYKTVVVCDTDINGNWTNSHIFYENNSMEKYPFVERIVFNDLTASEESMIDHYINMQKGYNATSNKLIWLGILAMVIAGIMAAFTLWGNKVSHYLRSRLAGWFVGPLAVAGFYIVNTRIYCSFGAFADIIFATLFIVAIGLYMRFTMQKLQDDTNLSNKKASFPFTPTMIFMCLQGWYTGGMIGSIWWAAILGALSFGSSLLFIADRGLRCPKCHRIGTMYHNGDIELGKKIFTHNHIHHNYQEVTIETIRNYKKQYECAYCHYREISHELKEVIDKKTERFSLSHSYSSHESSNQTSKSTNNSANIDYKVQGVCFDLFDCKNYNGHCTNHIFRSLGSDSEPCAYSNYQLDCPYFSPSNRFIERTKSKINNDNTHI